MPIVRIGTGLVYYAHVPKCGGTSVEDYLRDRFGPLGFLNRAFTALPAASRWSATSPQHIDWASLSQLFPPDYFTAAFAVVRHPVAHAFSAWQFQAEVEKVVSPDLAFAVWLRQQAEFVHKNPFLADNHLRPQGDFIGEDCTIFHLEHGLEAIIPWLDQLAGNQTGPRAMAHSNKGAAAIGAKPIPSSADIALIAGIYAGDFARFGYAPDQRLPLAPMPDPGPDFLAQAAAARARAGRLIPRTTARIKRRLRKWLG